MPKVRVRLVSALWIAQRMGIDKRTFTEMVRRGRAPRPRFQGTRNEKRLWARAEIEAWIEGQKLGQLEGEKP
jgi:predicted DNA-binding transcriptional regulator AlpA